MLHIILFLPVAAVVVALLLWALGGTGCLRNVEYHLGHGDRTFTRAREAERCGPVDVLFVGSSHAYRSFDPRIFADSGLAVFNLGSSNQTPLQSEALLHRYLDDVRPRMVVLEVHPDIMMYDGVESSLYWFCNASPSWSMVPLMLRGANAKVFCTGVYAALRNTFDPRFGRFSEPMCDEVNCYVSGGYVERADACWSPVAFPSTVIEPLPVQLHALRRIAGLLQSRGVPLLLLTVPDTRALSQSYLNLDEFGRLMTSYGDYHALHPDMLDDSLHYYDEGHLNQRGVELLDKYVIDLIYEHLGTDVGHLARRSGSGALLH